MTELQKILRRIRASVQNTRGVHSIKRHRVWFVDIPRTGSSALKSELFGKYGAAYGKSNIIEPEFRTTQLIPDHQTASQMMKRLGPNEWDNIYSFSFVRNPFDRMLSFYYYRKKVRSIPSSWTFPVYVRQLANADSKTPHFEYPPFRLLASDFVFDGSGNLLVKETFRFEDREAALDQLAERLGVGSFLNIRAQSASPKGKKYREAYDAETRAIAERFVSRDLENFQYKF